jgi:precorrin-2 dehydrogenase/sirohydrochlorin ferrochelatase
MIDGNSPDEILSLALVLRGRPVLVVGGGRVAAAKVERLLACGAVVNVVAPWVCDQLRAWIGENRVTWLARKFQPDDVQGRLFVIAATGHREVEAEVSAACDERQILCNCADVPEHSSAWLLAQRRRGLVVVAVGTTGRAPGLTGRIADELADRVPVAAVAAVERYADLRQEALRSGRRDELAKLAGLPWTELARASLPDDGRDD